MKRIIKLNKIRLKKIFPWGIPATTRTSALTCLMTPRWVSDQPMQSVYERTKENRMLLVYHPCLSIFVPLPLPLPLLSLSLSLPLSLPYPATTDGINDCFRFDHERGTIPVCTSVKKTRERVKHEEWDNEEDEGGKRQRVRGAGEKWTYKKKKGNGFHSFQTRLPWSDACWLVWKG